MTRKGEWRLSPRSLSVATVGLVAFLAVAVRVPFFWWPLTNDEGAYAYTAYWWFRGVRLYSPDLWLNRPQGIFVAYKLGMELLGGSVPAIRLWGALWSAGTTAVVWVVARHLFDRRAGVAASLLYAFYSVGPSIEGFTANAEVFMVLPATLSAYFLLVRRPFWAGFLASVALLLKPSGASAFVLAVFWLGYERRVWREWLAFTLAAVPLLGLALWHGASTVGLSAYAGAAVGFDAMSYRLRLGSKEMGSQRALATWMLTAPVWLPLALLGRIGVGKMERRTVTFLILWCVSSLLGVAVGGRWYWHYFVQLVPPLTVVAGAGLVCLWDGGRRWLRVGGPLFAAACFILVQGPFFVLEGHEGSWLLYRRRAYIVADDVARYVRFHTQQDETIYVAFYSSELTYLTGRRSAFPYMFRQHLLQIEGAYDRLLEVISEQVPTYVVVLDAAPVEVDRSARFWHALEDGYSVEAFIGGVPVYRRNAKS